MDLFPYCEYVNRSLEIGGIRKEELIEKLKKSSVSMNDYAQQLLTDPSFPISETAEKVATVELAVKNLGYPDGATTDIIYHKVKEIGLELCPLELAPHLRLTYLDQVEYQSSTRNRAPIGSVTVASQPLRDQDHFPKGFYLRKINEVLWLRGYLADGMHIWSPEDRFVFMRNI